MKKLLTSFLCLLLLTGCTAWSNRLDSVKEITLSMVEQDYFKNEEITITINTNCRYQLVPTDFVLFGGSIEVVDEHTAHLSFPSAGTFHVYALANDVKSNELIIKVVSENATAYRVSDEVDAPKKEIVRNPPEIPYTEKDFSDIDVLFSADISELADSDKVARNIKDYVGYMFAMEGTMDVNGDKLYLLSTTGKHIPLTNGYDIVIVGPIRVYGIMEENGFHVKVYSYGNHGIDAVPVYIPSEEDYDYDYEEEDYDYDEDYDYSEDYDEDYYE